MLLLQYSFVHSFPETLYSANAIAYMHKQENTGQQKAPQASLVDSRQRKKHAEQRICRPNKVGKIWETGKGQNCCAYNPQHKQEGTR